VTARLAVQVVAAAVAFRQVDACTSEAGETADAVIGMVALMSYDVAAVIAGAVGAATRVATIALVPSAGTLSVPSPSVTR
jgi:hypothetical protein